MTLTIEGGNWNVEELLEREGCDGYKSNLQATDTEAPCWNYSFAPVPQ